LRICCPPWMIDMKRTIIVGNDSIGMSNKDAEELVKQIYDRTPYVRKQKEYTKPMAKCHICFITYEVQFMVDVNGRVYPVLACPKCKGTDYQEMLG